MEPVHPTDVAFWYAIPILTVVFILAAIYSVNVIDHELIVKQMEVLRGYLGFLVEWF